MNYAEIQLKGVYREIGPQVAGLENLMQKRGFRLDCFYEQVERILASRSIKRVLVRRRERFTPPPFGGLEEIRSGLERLSAAGKELYYYATEYEYSDCVLSSACKRRIIHPLGTVSFLGISATGVFFKKLLESHDVGVEVIRRGRYKSAADPFRTEEFDEHAREQLQRLLDGAVDYMREQIARSPFSSRLSGEPLDEMLAGRIYTARDARHRGLVDELRDINELIYDWKKAKVKKKSPKLRGSFGRGPRVAVLVFEGAIVDGDTRRVPLMGQAIGDRTMVEAIRALREDRRVKAVVFRINSGGGSATASDNILRELIALHEKKPLIISMGPVAGSGGYWISMTGRRVLASPTTITGSIGVVTLFFNLSRLLERHGITVDCVKHGSSADLGSALREMTDSERATIDGVVEFLYRDFVDKVAAARAMTPERVHELGEGRVWLGRDAKAHGLVDELGGLHEAIAQAKTALEAKRVRVSFGPKPSLLSNIIPKRHSAASAWTHGSPLIDLASRAEALVDGKDGACSGSPAAIARACLSLHGRPQFLTATINGPSSSETFASACRDGSRSRILASRPRR